MRPATLASEEDAGTVHADLGGNLARDREARQRDHRTA